MFQIANALATVKIVPVWRHNFSQFSPWSLSSLVALTAWFLAPGALFVIAEIKLSAEVSLFPTLSRDIFVSLAYFLTASNMLMMLLAGPQLLGILMRRSDALFDLEKLPMPRRQWMIWLAAPLVALGFVPGGFDYCEMLQENPDISWEVAHIFCVLHNLILIGLSSVVQTSLLLIVGSILTYSINSFEDLKSINNDIDHVIATCDMYDDISKALSPIYMLMFCTSSSTVMMMSFVLYRFLEPATMVYGGTWIMNGMLILFYLAFTATDCEDVINSLRLHYRLISTKQNVKF